VEAWVVFEELGEEAAVSVTEDEGAAAIEDLREEVQAAVFEGFGECEVFEPSIWGSDEIEVGSRRVH
jgi:hypothetical protein